MARAPRPDDIYRFRLATQPAISPDGRFVAFTLQTVAPGKDGYRHAIWMVRTDGREGPRQLTIGTKHDRRPRFSPDGRILAFISDRRLTAEELPGAPTTEEREDANQVYLLPLDGPGEARRLTDLPRGVDDFAWSPDGSRLAVVSSSHGATREEDARRRGKPLEKPKPGEAPRSDYRFIDRLSYMRNAAGFTYDKVTRLWLVDVESGKATPLTNGRSGDQEPVWSQDGRRIAFTANRRPNYDLGEWQDVFVVDVESRRETRLTPGGEAIFGAPAWLPDGRRVAVLGHRFPAGGGSRYDIWLVAADGSDARDGGTNLSGRHDIMPGSTMGSDTTVGEDPLLAASRDGRWITFTAPSRGSYELWRVSTRDGEIERLTEGRQYISSFDQAGLPGGEVRIAYLRSSPKELPDVHLLDVPATAATQGKGRRLQRRRPRRLTGLNGELLDEVKLAEPSDRWIQVDGREVQAWYLPPAAGRAGSPAPLITEIHGGPHTLYGWAPYWEFQLLAADGMGVHYANPRGSEGYGQDFNAGNFRDWGPGPMRDVMAGIDALVAEGLANPDRLGVTGGSYGGYLTSWMIAQTDRFKAAITCRSVNDLTSQMMTGDIAGPSFGRLDLGAAPWEDPDIFRAQSPITHARNIRTPLLIQHSEKDLRTPIGQAEELFTILRSLRRPVRLMRVPEETHELTRSGTPFRRVENAIQVRDWFHHFLVDGRRRLPALPRVRGGL
jgi:dipeptidyl aminopeptidase/acylaminoacyl peptidase